MLFDEDFIGPQKVRLKGRRYKHIVDVHRVRQGQELIVGRVNQRVGKGQITELNEKHLEMDVDFFDEPPEGLDVILILALARPIVLKRMLADVAALGIKKIFLINSARVEKSFWKSHALQPEKIQQQLYLGMEQAKDTVVPEVFLKRRFKPFVEDELPHLIEGRTAWVAHPDAFQDCPKQVSPPAALFIGPEGGLIPYEVDAFTSIGFQSVHLGLRILRVETAVPFLLSRFQS